MSRLAELLEQACRVAAQLGADLKAEVDSLTKRRTFGLVFEAHQPESVDLPGRPVRRGEIIKDLGDEGCAVGQTYAILSNLDNLAGLLKVAVMCYILKNYQSEAIQQMLINLKKAQDSYLSYGSRV